MIKVQNLVFDYMTKRALHSVSFEIEKGSIVALIGPNGAGKTTLMRCMAGLVKPFSGSVHLNNINVAEEARRSHKYISYLSDVFGLYDDLKAYDCLRYAALAYGIADDKVPAAIKKAAAKLKITEYLNDYAGNLSRGNRQKLAIAQVIINSPKFIILDEPASGLDPAARLELSKLFVQLKDEGHTLLISSHILAELEDYATNVIVLDKGKIVKNEKITAKSKKVETNIEINLKDKHAALIEFLKKDKKVVEPVRAKEVVRFGFTGKDADLAKLLKDIISKGFTVVEFMKASSSVRAAYFETLGKGK
jgi:ABC-2 type transport system ATP-binding protein